jgi:hypothetical protein
VFARALCLAQPVDFFKRVTQLMSTRCLSAILAAIFLATGLSSVANAALSLDGATVLTSGPAPFNYDTAPKLFGRVDYTVYSPGSLSFPDKYVYCYQIYDYTTSSDIGSFTINLCSVATAYNPNWDASTGGINPISASLQENVLLQQNDVVYTFSSRAPITAYHNSSVLFFTSDFSWQLGSGVITDTSKTSHASVSSIPVPTPEPASLLLLTLATPFLLKTRRRKPKTTQ